ncbi:uncharacterized protein B0H18DRAFT_1125242 [Fomitopsis serialis]|uniref:uncharacterized protein n=1 Tax=Fomitopsis serialis TaxID=139415 RepID=UPI002007DECB|nr:uncharacterized protein B0H18DRAFT_1125242 [Neoantrodia serialis]KAH9914855.1 hypothetical protein B0H18DRAFT_1125242 [Neoantrodia serialis]
MAFSRIDSHLINILVQNGLPSYQKITRGCTRQCPHGSGLNHVTVVCLEREHIGELFDFASCMMHESMGCTMVRCPDWWQPSLEMQRVILDQVHESYFGLQGPFRMGGWVYVGAFEDFHRSDGGENPQFVAGVPPGGGGSQSGGSGDSSHRLGTSLTPHVTSVSNGTYQDIDDRVSVPLLCKVDETGHEMEIPGPAKQPLLLQMFPGLSPWKPLPHTGLGAAGFDLYDVRGQTFIPTATLPNERLTLHLPLRHIPTFKLTNVSVTFRASDRATGAVASAPTCPMKHSFTQQPYIWAADSAQVRGS